MTRDTRQAGTPLRAVRAGVRDTSGESDVVRDLLGVGAKRANVRPENEKAFAATSRRAELRRLFERHNESLVRRIATKLGSRNEAKDVAQEAFARILGLDDTRVVNHLRAYLFKTANNIAVDRLRERTRRSGQLDIDPDDIVFESEDSRVEQAVDAVQRLELIGRSLAELPPKCRMAFLLFKIEGRSYAEIASQLGVSESMIRKYVLRALRHCHTRLTEQSATGLGEVRS